MEWYRLVHVQNCSLFFFQAEDGIRDIGVTGVQTCALPICIHLRGFAQIDPLVAYKNEGFELFKDLMNTIWSDFARMVYNVEVEVEGDNGSQRAALDPSATAGAGVSGLQFSGGTLEDQPSAYGGEGYGVDADEASEPVV